MGFNFIHVVYRSHDFGDATISHVTHAAKLKFWHRNRYRRIGLDYFSNFLVSFESQQDFFVQSVSNRLMSDHCLRLLLVMQHLPGRFYYCQALVFQRICS